MMHPFWVVVLRFVPFYDICGSMEPPAVSCSARVKILNATLEYIIGGSRKEASHYNYSFGKNDA